MSACDFCQIIKGEQDAQIVCSSESVVAFFPLQPATMGHTLIVPKIHVADFLSAEDHLSVALFVFAGRVGRALMRALSPEGMNAITSAGEAATQTVFHLHIHLVPRWRDDAIGDIWPDSPEVSDDEDEEVAKLVRNECAVDYD